MRWKALKICLLFVLMGAVNSSAENLSTPEIVQRIVDRATRNEQETANYGFDAAMAIRWINTDGSAKKVEARDYRTVWDQGMPRLELHRINQAPLTPKQRQKEEESRLEWKRTINAQQTSSAPASVKIPISWADL